MTNNHIILHVQLRCKNISILPNYKIIKSWVHAIFSIYKRKIELTIRIVDENEMYHLQKIFSKKNYLTNVLSFPVTFLPKVFSPLLGDIVICQSIIKQEARNNNVSFHVHLAHMIIHGSLHLIGYNHVYDVDSILMLQREKYIMKKCGYNTCCYSMK